jgi:plastocyanin
MAQHPVHITRGPKGEPQCNPREITAVPGDTIEWLSEDGTVEIVFGKSREGNPFESTPEKFVCRPGAGSPKVRADAVRDAAYVPTLTLNGISSKTGQVKIVRDGP